MAVPPPPLARRNCRSSGQLPRSGVPHHGGGHVDDKDFSPFIMRDVRLTGRQLGSGSYGSVVELISDGLPCAGKKIHSLLVDRNNVGRDAMTRKYLEECRLMASLRHPNLVQFLGVCFLPDSSEFPVLVMELMGIDLDDFLSKYTQIPLGVKCSILRDIACGLVYLHRHEPPIIHRDLSAKNVLLNSAMVAKITDLGVARLLDVSPSHLSQQLTQVPGTWAYMAPETISENPKYDTSSDVFSFGHLSLYVLIQVFPVPSSPTYISAESPGAVLGRSELERRASFVKLLRQKLKKPEEEYGLVGMVTDCLDNNPRKRPSSYMLLQQLATAKEKVPDPYLDMNRMELIEQLQFLQSQVSIMEETVLISNDEITELKRKLVATTATDSRSTDTSINQQKIVNDQNQHFPIVRRSSKPPVPPRTAKKTLMDESWYFGEIDKDTAISLCKANGDYLIRYSSRRKQYVISLLWDNQGVHVPVVSLQLPGDSKESYQIRDNIMPSIQELVNYLVTFAVPLSSIQAILLNPVSRDKRLFIKRSDITLGKEIDRGSFGKVFEATMLTCSETVAAKRSCIEQNQHLLFLEALNLSRCQHPNILRVIGVCPACTKSPTLLVSEYMAGGSLRIFLREKGYRQSKSKLLHMCLDVCSGIEYLASKKFVFLHLATRNCLIGPTHNVKLSGLKHMKEVVDGEYIVKEKETLPIRWTAPEVFMHGSYTIASDVWSFGILMREVFSNGTNPYPEMTNDIVKKKVQEGYQMPPPSECPPRVYSIMKQCWHQLPNERPNLPTLLRLLKETANALSLP